jgi:hypothetical protein
LVVKVRIPSNLSSMAGNSSNQHFLCLNTLDTSVLRRCKEVSNV